ncbi:MAG: hypothetical protein R2812_00145 [Gelidibacter sp.]
MKNFLSVIFFFLSVNIMFSQYDPQAYDIHIEKFKVNKDTFVTSVLIFHSFDNDKFISELEKEFGVFKKVIKEENISYSYSSSKIKYKKWSTIPFTIYLDSKMEIRYGSANERGTKLYFKGKLVDIPRKITVFYILNDQNTDILLSKKTQKKVRKFLIKTIHKVTNQ